MAAKYKQIIFYRVYGFRNCEFFGVNMRSELLKSFIIKGDKVINVTI